MSVNLPAVVDVWRMVSASRVFEGTLPLSAFPRLRGSLVDAEGECRYRLEFGQSGGQAFVEVQAEGSLPLQCQRSLERYLQPVRVMQQLGLVTSEAQESALPEAMEPLLVPEGGEVRPADLIEDELILALPVVPIDPAARLPDEVEQRGDEDKPNPFAVLRTLKDTK
jgi:uncharacterized protein